MQTIITIDMTGATAVQALELVAHLNRKGLAFEVGNRAEAHDVSEPHPLPAKPRERKPRAAKADNGGSAAILEAVEQTDGSVSAITARLGDSPSKVQRALKKLRENGEVFMAGERRFARYGTTLAQATERSEAAQGKP